MQTSLLLDLVADICPERIAVSSGSNDTTFAELKALAAATADWLSARDAAQNVVFVGLNGSVMPILLFASALAGMRFVPVNYRLSDTDLRKLVARTAPSVLIVDDDMKARVANIDGVEVISTSEFQGAVVPGEAANSAGLVQDENDIAVLLFTSGTTGDPKAAILRHANLTSYVMSTVELLGSSEDEAALVSVPPYHIAGISAILTSIYAGRRIVYLPSFTPEEWVSVAARQGITHAMVVPTMLDRILDVMGKKGEALGQLKAISYGGGRMPEPVIARALELLPQVDFVNAYGLTETSSTISLLGPQDHRDAIESSDPAIRRRLGSVGKPLPGLELEIRNEAGESLGPEVPGEIYVRGKQVSGEYLNKKMVAADGWFATNDQGWLDPDGYLFVEGRLDDVIVRGGENISPGEIEDVLREHENVADVAILGMPDDQWGEKVVAVLVCRFEANCDGLSDFVRTRLRSTKTPEEWHFRDELPYNETGKLLRRILKAELAAIV